MIDLQKEINFLRDSTNWNIEKSFSLAKQAQLLFQSDNMDDSAYAREIVVHVLDQWAKVPSETKEMWSDLVEVSGFYPYLEKEESQLAFNNLPGRIRKEIHKSENLHGKYLHEEQLYALDLFDSGKNLIVSAPTSFGKSLLIEELVARKEFKNIIIIQPTLALLEETRKNLKKYRDEYRLIVKTSQNYSLNERNIFLLTAERVLEYPKFPDIDLLVIDEFYKMSTYRHDERADTLNVAFYKVLKEHNPRFYLLGPNIDGVSAGFSEAYNAIFYKTNYSLVTADIIDLYTEHKEHLSHPRKSKEYIEELLFKTLIKLDDEQTLVYCSSPERTREISKKFLQYKKEKVKNIVSTETPLTTWIDNHIHKDWTIGECLSYGIGVHDAALPRHISASIIHQFNRNQIKQLFCTSTIIEGVNTSAKNVIIFDKSRGSGVMDFFDYSNIKGRAGRLMVHYVGRVFNFHPVPKAEQVTVDFPFFDQGERTSEEVFIQIAQEDIKNLEAEHYQSLQSLSAGEKNLFRGNGVSVFGQKKILDQVAQDIKNHPELILWSGIPNKDQRQYIIDLCWDNLRKPGETKGILSPKQVNTLAGLYSHEPNIMSLVANEVRYWRDNNKKELTRVELIDEAIRKIFQFQRHWLDYKLPKWFYVVNSIQEYVCDKIGVKAGDYTFYATSMENDFLDARVTFLMEMGLPRSAISKIEVQIGELISEEEIISFIRANTERFGFTEYELECVREI